MLEDDTETAPIGHFSHAASGCGPLLPIPRESRPLRQRLLEQLRACGFASRLDLARDLDVSPASVTATAAELIGLGLILETPVPRDVGRGRPPVALSVSPSAYAVAGIKLSDEAHTAVIVDFAGNVTGEATRPSTTRRRSIDETLFESEALLDGALQAAGMSKSGLSGLGLGLPGIIDHERGLAVWSPILAQRDVDLADRLAERIGMPVALDNDANLLTLAELWFGAGRALPDFAVVTIEHGVGMGLVINNRLFRGASGFGMELGHTKVALDGALCRCGRRGCLEAYVADYALVREARTNPTTGADAGESVRAMLQRLFADAELGDAAARSIFERAGRHLAMGLSNVVQLFDPSLIILSGAQVRFATLYADRVIAEMRTMTLETGRPVPVEVNAWGDMVWARGAAAMALTSLTERIVGEHRAI